MGNSRLQEIIMIPALIVVILAVYSIRDTSSRLIASTIVLCQMITHINMTIKPFSCNPKKGKLCNKFAFVAGFVLFIVFMKVMIINKQVNPCILFSALVAMYSIISHIIHIDMSGSLHNILSCHLN